MLSRCRDRIPGSPRRIVSLTRRQPPPGVNDSSGFRSYAEMPPLTAPESRDADACATYIIGILNAQHLNTTFVAMFKMTDHPRDVRSEVGGTKNDIRTSLCDTSTFVADWLLRLR
ncbi:unnamed protein product [Arctia plantaginis]|uniref:Uncharacterized protein n=1 Tax=Arctia plantaginis TaxID=874455 RepID=A0A8S0ZWN8_ARCPL|nr:unnamed protein product [Arctia plantaginis]